MIVEAGGEAALTVAVLGIAGDGDEEGVGKRRFGAKDAGDLIAVEAGEAEVEEQDFRAEFPGGRHAGGAAVGAARFAAT